MTSGAGDRCARLTGRPVLKSSRTRTRSPDAERASTRWEPMKPAPPVTRKRPPIRTSAPSLLEPPATTLFYKQPLVRRWPRFTRVWAQGRLTEDRLTEHRVSHFQPGTKCDYRGLSGKC